MKKSLISFVETFTVGILLAILTMVFVGQSLEITGDSMYPTLKNGERLVVEKVTYKGRVPQRGEIVVFRSLQNESIFLIKRVIALPGDTIGLSDGVITVNGNPLDESYLLKNVILEDLGKLDAYNEYPIPKGYFAVMGDNREVSFDSRMFGVVPLDNLVGKAFVVYWPPTSIKKV
jgi:signal peptidase I